MGKILQGDCLGILKTLQDKSINCCVTSPPYYGLRDYGMNEQIGLEQTPEEYIQKIVDVFHEVKRVLKDDGTLWVNIGDSYAGGKGRWGGSKNMSNKQVSNNGSLGQIKKSQKWEHDIIKQKDLIGIPWMLAFALRADGWYLRQDIIWHKPNPMPESVKDRCTKSHEYIFLLSKEPRYYFDYKAIQEDADPKNKSRYNAPFMTGKMQKTPRPTDGHNTEGMKVYTGKRNKRDVWKVVVKHVKEAHFATFPEDLITPCILAGCPKNGTVLDPFFGSGTTGRVATKYGRDYVGIELNPEYIEIAKKRNSEVQTIICEDFHD